LYIPDVEKVLKGSQGQDEVVKEAAETAAKLVEPPSDVHGSSEFRRQMVRVLTARALREAWSK
jgi:CO/xanthine dehydrogenase FAD-binding subunit